MCVVGIQLQGRKCNNLHRICIEKPEMSNVKCQYLPSKKKQLETCFFLILLFFHALSTGDDKSSVNTIDIQIMRGKCRYISRKIVFRLDLLSPVDRA